MNDKLYEQQLNREQQSATAGYNKFQKREDQQARFSDGSNTTFGIYVKKYLLGRVVEEMKQALTDLHSARISRMRAVLDKCLLGLTEEEDYSNRGLWDITEAAFLGLQLALDTALNPNHFSHTTQGRYGGDKKLLQKKSLAELEHHIGKTINTQMGLRLIKTTFPEWFRKENLKAERKNKEGAKASTSYWEYRMKRALRLYADELEENGDEALAELIRNRNVWTYAECRDVGAWVIRSLLKATNLFEVKTERRKGKQSNELYLTEEAAQMRGEITEYAAMYAHDVLPMLITPEPITNDNLGGWLTDVLQEQDLPFNGSIQLSDKHLEFINRQARVPFQINPFTYQLIEELVERQLPLGKFHYQPLLEVPPLNQLLGLDHIQDKEEQTRLVRAHKDYKEKMRFQTDQKDQNIARMKKSLLAQQVLGKARQLLNDEQFFIPMKYCFRGRIYSRIPFISFQSNDCGRYLIRFANKTPIDDRTEHWLKVGMANAGGQDKKSWDERLNWTDKNLTEIINIGRMMNDGDFSRAYDFLTRDGIDDPFCLAALANEYVKVFVDKTQSYTQVYVCADASCSGTAIFNAWRRNLRGARMVNLVDTPAPADIYIAVWYELKRIAPAGSFREDHIKRLEASKLLRKMMKEVYVPASYASPTQEQLMKLKGYNRHKLKPADLHFTDEEMDILCSLWETALDDVSSISCVVKWFKERAREILANGADEIIYTSPNGSVMKLKYPKTKLVKVRTLHYGSALFRTREDKLATDEPNKSKLTTAITSNITHLTDAAALCSALWDLECPFVGIHDACGLPPSKLMDEGLKRLKQGFIDATEYSVWDTLRTDNGLPLSPQTAPPIVGDLDLNLIRQSNYIYS